MRRRIVATAALLLAVAASPVAARSDAVGPRPPVHHQETNQQAFALPMPGLAMQELRGFAGGNRLFNLRWVAAPASASELDGLGPTFAQASCSSCHLRDGRSRLPAGDDARITAAVLRLAPSTEADRTWLDAHFGEHLQTQAIHGVDAEAQVAVRWVRSHAIELDGQTITLRKPAFDLAAPLHDALRTRATIHALVAPSVFGLGLIEQIPAHEIEAAADADDRDGDGISGRAQRVAASGGASIGRFGWKANVASLREQIAAAAWADMGLTSSAHPDENCPRRQASCRRAARGQTVDLSERALDTIETYLRVLAVPESRTDKSQAAMRGQQSFRDFGCAACHREQFRTGNGSDVAALNDQTIRPYSDFLLHDMGPNLAAAFHAGDAAANEWRTPPLWGIGLQQTVNGHLQLLHDGRADGLVEAILWHEGEATRSRDAFIAATSAQRDDLIRFLESL